MAGRIDGDFLDEVGRMLEPFFTLSTVKSIMLVDTLPDNDYRNSLRDRKRCSWMDDKEPYVYMYIQNIGGARPEYWQGHVLRAAIGGLGLAGLFPDGHEGILDALNGRFGDSGMKLNSLALWDALLANRSVERTGPEFWKGVAESICFPLGLKAGELVTRCIRDGYEDICRKGREMRLGRDSGGGLLSAVVPEVRQKLLGNTGDVLRSLGYPEVAFVVNPGKLSHLLDKDGVSFTDDDVARGFRYPLMALRSRRSWSDGTVPVMAVTDLFAEVEGVGRQYLAFSVPPPERVAGDLAGRALAGDGKAVVSCAPFMVSEAKLGYSLAGKENWMYMRPTVEGDGFEYVERLKKNVAAVSPVLKDSGSNRRSLAATKIAESFENPKVLHKNNVPEDVSVPVMEQVSRMAEKTARDEAGRSAALLPARGVKVAQRARDRAQEPFPKNVVDGPVRERLFNAGIVNAVRVAEVGFDRVREVAGQDRAVNRIADWMAGRGIFVYSKSDRLVPDMKPSGETVLSHLYDCICKGGGSLPGVLPLPRNLEGELFMGSDAVHLMLADTGRKAAACPYWATEKELLDIGCRPGKALPVPLWRDGDPGLVYNVSATDFPKRYPREYGDLVGAAGRDAQEDRETGRYFSIIAGSLGEVPRRKMDSLAAWMDNSTSASFERLRSVRRSSLREAVGESAMKEMIRKGKTLKMYDTVKLATAVARDKGRRR